MYNVWTPMVEERASATTESKRNATMTNAISLTRLEYAHADKRAVCVKYAGTLPPEGSKTLETARILTAFMQSGTPIPDLTVLCADPVEAYNVMSVACSLQHENSADAKGGAPRVNTIHASLHRTMKLAVDHASAYEADSPLHAMTVPTLVNRACELFAALAFNRFLHKSREEGVPTDDLETVYPVITYHVDLILRGVREWCKRPFFVNLSPRCFRELIYGHIGPHALLEEVVSVPAIVARDIEDDLFVPTQVSFFAETLGSTLDRMVIFGSMRTAHQGSHRFFYPSDHTFTIEEDRTLRALAFRVNDEVEYLPDMFPLSVYLHRTWSVVSAPIAVHQYISYVLRRVADFACYGQTPLEGSLALRAKAYHSTSDGAINNVIDHFAAHDDHLNYPFKDGECPEVLLRISVARAIRHPGAGRIAISEIRDRAVLLANARLPRHLYRQVAWLFPIGGKIAYTPAAEPAVDVRPAIQKAIENATATGSPASSGPPKKKRPSRRGKRSQEAPPATPAVVPSGLD